MRGYAPAFLHECKTRQAEMRLDVEEIDTLARGPPTDHPAPSRVMIVAPRVTAYRISRGYNAKIILFGVLVR